jgi:hypothetical protein
MAPASPDSIPWPWSCYRRTCLALASACLLAGSGSHSPVLASTPNPARAPEPVGSSPPAPPLWQPLNRALVGGTPAWDARPFSAPSSPIWTAPSPAQVDQPPTWQGP